MPDFPRASASAVGVHDDDGMPARGRDLRDPAAHGAGTHDADRAPRVDGHARYRPVNDGARFS